MAIDIQLEVDYHDKEMVVMRLNGLKHYLLGAVHIDNFFPSDIHDKLNEGKQVIVTIEVKE